MIPTVVITTRGDVDLTPALEALPSEWPRVIWNNSEHNPSMRVYGYFAALDLVETEYVYTQADDCVIDARALLDEWRPDDSDRIVVNEQDGETPWISFGAIFRADVAIDAISRYTDAFGADDDLLDWCEVVLTTLVPWRNVPLGKVDLPWAFAPNRMWTSNPNHFVDQARVRDKVRALLGVPV